jgi:hypothetical protein
VLFNPATEWTWKALQSARLEKVCMPDLMTTPTAGVIG